MLLKHAGSTVNDIRDEIVLNSAVFDYFRVYFGDDWIGKINLGAHSYRQLLKLLILGAQLLLRDIISYLPVGHVKIKDGGHFQYG